MLHFNREPVWHASCSMRGLDGIPIMVRAMTENERGRILARLAMALHGVGALGEDIHQDGRFTLQMRRRATIVEKRQANLTRLGQPHRNAP